MTELPDDMEAVVERVALPWIESEDVSVDTEELTKAGQAVRALLKAYQEQRRALERLANKENEFGSEVQTIARAALNQKGLAEALLPFPAALRPTDTGWRDIATAPKDGTHFLAVDESGDASRCAYHSHGYIMSFCGQPVVQPFEPVLWMPWTNTALPPAPTDTGRGG
jgi:hypothetical protein